MSEDKVVPITDESFESEVLAKAAASYFLRRALLGNGVFSLISGIILIVTAKPLSELFGLSMSAILTGLGVSLLLYAAGLFRNALQEEICQTEALLAVILDAAWVVGSVVLITTGILTRTGNWTAAIVADVVLLFAVLQFIGLRRMRKEDVMK